MSSRMSERPLVRRAATKSRVVWTYRMDLPLKLLVMREVR